MGVAELCWRAATRRPRECEGTRLRGYACFVLGQQWQEVDTPGPGDDVLDGVARLYRRRAHGLPDGDALASWHLMEAMLEIAPHRAPELLGAVLERLADDD